MRAVSWPLFRVMELLSQSGKPWQLCGHFSEFTKSGYITGKAGSPIVTTYYVTAALTHEIFRTASSSRNRKID